MHQLMFKLEFAEKDGSLMFVRAYPPHIDSKPIHKFAQEILDQATEFSAKFFDSTQ
jgi:hypothetical protein